MRQELARSVGKTIAQWRNSRGMTQEQLALALDVDSVTISRFERGVTLPSLPSLHKIAGIFGVALPRLLEEAPSIKFAEAEMIAALMETLSTDERSFILDTIKRYCQLKAHKPKGE